MLLQVTSCPGEAKSGSDARCDSSVRASESFDSNRRRLLQTGGCSVDAWCRTCLQVGEGYSNTAMRSGARCDSSVRASESFDSILRGRRRVGRASTSPCSARFDEHNQVSVRVLARTDCVACCVVQVASNWQPESRTLVAGWSGFDRFVLVCFESAPAGLNRGGGRA